MFLFVSGLPGGFASWCERAVAGLAARAGQASELIRADTLAQIAAAAIAAGVSEGVVSSCQAGGRLRAALSETGARFVVALDDPRTALVDLVLRRGTPLPDAVQQLAGSCAAARALASMPGALVLHAPPRPDTLAAVARHLGIAIGARDLAELAAALEPAEPALTPADATAWWSGLDPGDQHLAMGALAPFLDGQAERAPVAVNWARQLFFVADRPSERAITPVDITGRARCLVHGPHIMLPAGFWSLSLRALFSPEASEHEFLAEVWADRMLARGALRPQDGGAGLRLDFALDEMTEDPVAIRISSQRAAFDGAILGVEASLFRTAADRGGRDETDQAV